MPDSTQKSCATCGVTKDVALFRPQRRTCRDCAKVASRKYHADHREERNKQSLEIYRRNRESRLLSMSAYDKANREQRNAYLRKWKARNREASRANGEAWRANNIEKVRESNRLSHSKRRARLLGAGAIGWKELDAKLAYWGRSCWMCGGDYEHLDHVKPISKGGPHILANLRPACALCNMQKQAMWYGPRELHRFTKAGKEAEIA